MCIKMSDVRLSNASPTLERVDARQPDSTRPSVRRCLFGSPDRVELREMFEVHMQEEAHRFRDIYNFDPVEERPLPGRYRWEVDEDAPEFYRRPPHRRLDSQEPREGVRPRDREETSLEDRDETSPEDREETSPEDREETSPEDREETSSEDREEASLRRRAEAERARKRPSDPSGSGSSSEPCSKSSRSSHGESVCEQPDDRTCQAAQVPEDQ